MTKVINQIPGLKLGVIVIHGVRVGKKNFQLWHEIDGLCKLLSKKHAGKNLGEIKGITAVRKLYSSVGMDATKFRPSSEALLKRVLKKRDLYQINSVVDVNNLCSLKFLLPMGVYDLGKIAGNLTVRIGDSSEFYRGIGKGKMNANGRIVMVDQEKICGGPTTDSIDTMITLDTKNIILIMYAPTDYSDQLVEKYIDLTAGYLLKYNQGKVISKELLMMKEISPLYHKA